MIAVLAVNDREPRVPILKGAALWLLPAAIVAAVTVAVLHGQQNTYALYTPEGKRNLVVRGGSPETFALDQLAAPFGLTFTEDRVANGLVINTRKGRIVAIPDQSFVQVAGRGVVGLDGPIRRERNTWIAPIDFLVKGLGPAIGEPVVIRRSSKIILVGNVRLPQVGGRVEKTPAGARVVLTVQPATPHRVTRDGNKLTVRFDAVALDMTPVTGFIPEFASAAKVDGSSLIIDLGSSSASFKVEDTPDGTAIDLLPPAPVAPPPPPPVATVPNRPPQTLPAPQIEMAQGIRTIVIDPGHGGDDEGVKGTNETREKDLALQMAKRLKAAIESRLGIRVLLTRDGDEVLAVDRRAAFANYNKADLFLSVHANSSVRPAARGVQVYSLDVTNYPRVTTEADSKRRTVPTLGGGTRVIDPVPWELAQLPFAEQSSAFAATIVQQLGVRSVTLHSRATATAPLRVLAGANMPAVLIELGFLSNTEDAAFLGSSEGQAAMVEGLIAAITEVRRGFPPVERHRP
jgi:N-acetylmuramoyl-L-alanine amidase